MTYPILFGDSKAVVAQNQNPFYAQVARRVENTDARLAMASLEFVWFVVDESSG